MSFITQNIPVIGGLASQIQQYSSLLAVAKENNKEVVFSEKMKTNGCGFQFTKILDVPIRFEPESFFENFKTIQLNGSMITDPSMFNLDSDTNYFIDSRFDLFRYWYPKYKDTVLSWEWNKSYYERAKKKFEDLFPKNKELVSIHVRRGDYLLPHHHHFCILGLDYYNEALSYFMDNVEKYHFVVFSNDIEWCKEELIEGDMVTFMPPGPEDFPTAGTSETGIEDLIIMSMCDHNIIGNSSYSWWAAFKNKNLKKKVICPKNYLRDYSPFRHINGNWYPEDWIIIDNYNR
jgi:hypothetical protein